MTNDGAYQGVLPPLRHSIMLPAAMLSVFATSLALAQVFTQQAWLWPSTFAIVVAFGAGWLARRLDVPAVLSPALSVLALVAYLGFVFHRDTALAGFVPTSETMRAIGESLTQSTRDIRTLAAPADPTDALDLLSTAGVFLVAMWVDLLVFRARRPVTAGLPLLALFLVPTSLAEKTSLFAFVAAATGYLTLLVAEGRDRARAWGRRLSGIAGLDELNDVSHVSRVGRRIGTAAVGLALVVPIMLPNVGEGIFNGTGLGPFGDGGGDSSATVVSPLVTIQRQLRSTETTELLRVKTNQAAYLRLVSLDEYKGQEWRMRDDLKSKKKIGADHPIPPPREIETIPTLSVTSDISIKALDVEWLPVPYVPSVVDAKGSWRYDPVTLAVFSTSARSKGRTYTVESTVPVPTPDQLRVPGKIPDSIASRYLDVPDEGTPDAVKNALEVSGVNAAKTPYEKAVALVTFFKDPQRFTYDLSVPQSTSADALSDFLTTGHGYCEQFAATMAYMARLAGIPARVAVGFTPGTPQNGGEYSITNHDAHAWPELYFPSAGWVWFEPTPSTEANSHVVTPSYSAREEDKEPGTPSPTPTVSATPSASPEPSETPGARGRDTATDPENDPGNDTSVTATARRGATAVAPWVALAALVGLVTPSLVGVLVRRRRRTHAVGHVGRIHAAWEALTDAAEDTGHALRRVDSPRAAARRLVASASLTGSVADEVTRLGAAEERARYARTCDPVDGLDASARAVRRALVGALPWRSRLRARALPPSSVRRIRESFAALSRWLDRTRTAFRARLAAVLRRRPRAA